MTALARAETQRYASFAAPELAPADPTGFRAAMRQLACGVSLITVGAGAERRGMTATAVSSFSAEPPTLLVCVNQGASMYPGLRLGAAFGVSILSAESQEIADRFAGRTGVNGAERFEAGRWLIAPSGVALFADSVSAFECEVEELIERHTHAIVIGRILRIAAQGGDGALVYWRGDYDRLGWSADEIARAVGLSPSVTRG
jgi:flavin reductase (DIM6/NTAB) family NADH-FMN oxidoreductase RutF